jgi:hypothetical protein
MTLRNLKRFLPWGIIVVWFILQVPFLGADPDTKVDVHTRGAWTDEGLYSGTARNFLNTGTIDPYENSLLTRGPLFTLIQIPTFFVFGQSLLVARLMVLIFTIFTFALFLRREATQLIGILLVGLGFTQFHLFQFSHYAMAEILATDLILIAALLITEGFQPNATLRQSRRKIFGAALLLFFAYGLKIQFLYIAFLLPGFALIQMLPHIGSGSEEGRMKRIRFGYALGFSAALAALYAVAWYLPNLEFYHYVMSREVDSRYPTSLADLLGQSRFNFTELLFVAYLRPLIILGFIAIAGGLIWVITRPKAWRGSEKLMFLVGVLWFLGELHKIPMTYMPHRYLVSAYASMALISAVVLAVSFRTGKWAARAIGILVLGLAIWQLSDTAKAYQRRTYDLQAINSYLRQYDWKGKTITGAWAPSAAWGTNARVYPVWYGFVNDHRALDAAMIIAESDQEDSDRSLQMQGINLETKADSVRRFPVWRYEVDLHWLKPDTISAKHQE